MRDVLARGRRRSAVVTVVLLVSAGLFLLPAPSEMQSPPEDVTAGAGAPVFSPEALSERILSGAGDIIVLDVRPAEAWGAARVRGALSLPLDQIEPSTVDALPEQRRIVVYGVDDRESLEGWSRIAPSRPLAVVLEGGFERWRSEVLEPVEPAGDAPEEIWQAYRMRRAVADYFLGRVAEAPPETPVRSVQPVLRPRPKSAAGEGC